ncbi:MAG: 3-keto-L-gulonate-6-phosphate decarboxylase UlaD [Mycoplasmatales bacterium]|nr:3-keto-L-gulonate-6-phosphate decarboxylase UlaD [Mycoplasmatales bacterium]
MPKPMLQIALDTLTVDEAIENVEKIYKYIDVIEVGTILIASQGKKAIKEISNKYKDKIIVADGKIADAGSVFAMMFFDNGADFTTAICAAETQTIKSVLDTAKLYGKDKDVQIELTSNFNWKQVEEWKKIGIKQVVYHRSRDAQLAGVNWTQNDIKTIKKFDEMGFKVTITGGISLKDIEFFKDVNVYIFIVGRSIRDAENLSLEAQKFKDQIDKYYA